MYVWELKHIVKWSSLHPSMHDQALTGRQTYGGPIHVSIHRLADVVQLVLHVAPHHLIVGAQGQEIVYGQASSLSYPVSPVLSLDEFAWRVH